MTTDTPRLFQDGTLRSISREELADLPIRRYEGDVCLALTPGDLEAAMEDIRNETVVGLDTETRPAFRKGESHLPCLVQVATARTVYLFPLRRPDAYTVIRSLLEDARVAKAGVALAHDLRELRQVFTFEHTNVIELGAAARRCGYGQTGLRNLAAIFLDIRIPKGSRTSNWAAAQLTRQQITYAATDAWVCRELFLRFETLGLLDR
jgi:ribonuclease D